LYLEKIENKINMNINYNNTNFNEVNKIDDVKLKSSKANLDNIKVMKKTHRKFEILDEESKEESISNQDSIANHDDSLDFKNKENKNENEINDQNENDITHFENSLDDKNKDENLKNNKINDLNSNKNNNNINIENNSFNSNEQLQNSNSSSIIISNEENESEYRKFIRLVTSKEVSILFIILVLGVGSVIGNLNNIEFIIGSISKTTSRSDIFEYSILYFSFNSLSRLASGIIIDKLILEGKIFFFLLATSIFGLISQILGILMIKEYLIFSICLAGSVHGGLLTFAPIYTKNFFDINDMGKILGFLTTGAALGSVFVGNLIFTIFYEIFKKDDVCKGQKCFRYSFVITTCLFLVNIGLSVYLMRIMSKRLKKQKKIKEIEEENNKNIGNKNNIENNFQNNNVGENK